MNSLVEQAVKTYLENVKHPGKKVGKIEMLGLQLRLSRRLPRWYAKLLLDYPLAGVYLDYPVYEADDRPDGFASLRLARPSDIYSETEKCYPGLAIRKLGYACLAIDPTGSGDPYFVKVSDGDNPPVYQVYHDVSEIGSVIEAEGMRKIANSLSELFSKARVNNYHNPFEEL